MKKLISTILFAILLFSCLGLTVFAKTPVTLSEDYQTLTMDGKTYARVNASGLEEDYHEQVYDQVSLSEAQQKMIQSVSLETNESRTVVYATIAFLDGATLSVDFLQTDYLEDYQKIMDGQIEEYVIDFEWPEGNIVKAKNFDLWVNDTTLTEADLELCDYYYVSVQIADGSLSAKTGMLIVIDTDFYYMDFKEAGISNWIEFYPYTSGELPAHKITNEELISDLSDAETSYYADEFGFLYDDDLSETIASVFLIFLFAVIPFILLVLFLILAIRSKTVYKKLFRTIYILSGSVIVVFAIVAALIFL